MTVALQLSSEQAEQLAATARRLNVAVEDLAVAAARDLIARTEQDFQEAAQHVVAKNRELYQDEDFLGAQRERD